MIMASIERARARKTIAGALADAMILASFASCGSAGLQPAKAGSSSVTLRISSGGAGARTIGPAAPSIARCELQGRALPDGQLASLGVWTSLDKASVTLKTGGYDFDLSAYDQAGTLVLEGSLPGVEIAGPRSLDFALGSLAGGEGGVSIRITAPASTSLSGAYYSIGDRTDWFDASVVDGKPILDFEASGIPSGDYLLTFSLYNQGYEMVGTLNELVKVRRNLVSRKLIELKAEDFDSSPLAPSSLSASAAAGARAIDLAWGFPAGKDNDAQTIRIYRRAAADPDTDWSTIAIVDGNALDYQDTALAGGIEYLYKLAAENLAGIAESPGLRAQASALCKVDFDARNGIDSWTYYVTKGASVGELPVPTKDGASFDGWNKDPSANSPRISAGTSIDGDSVFYARWLRTVTFMPNGASGDSYAQALPEGVATPLAPCAFVKAGYVLAGWSSSANGDIEYVDLENYTVSAENPVLYARWISALANPASEFTYEYNWDGTSYGYWIRAYSGSSVVVHVPEFINKKPVTLVARSTFSGNTKVTEVHIGAISNLGMNSLFGSCSALRKVVLNDRIPEISATTFSGCSALESIVIPAQVTAIGYMAFYNCSSLARVTVLNPVPPNFDNSVLGVFYGTPAGRPTRATSGPSSRDLKPGAPKSLGSELTPWKRITSRGSTISSKLEPICPFLWGQFTPLFQRSPPC